MSLEVYRNLAQLEDISDSASKDYAIERILNKMLDDWQIIDAELKAWKDTKTYIVTGGSIDEIQ